MEEAFTIIRQELEKRQNSQNWQSSRNLQNRSDSPRTQNQQNLPLLVAIDGRCAAGKTTLAAALQKEFACNVIHMDHFFLQPQQRTPERLAEPGGNVDYERFLSEVLLPLTESRTFSYRIFDCKCMDFSGEAKVCPNRLTIVEGAYSCHPKFADFYDLRIFLDVDHEEQLRRIAKRNGEAALQTFEERWIPLEEKYFSEYQIPERCDYIWMNDR